MSVYIAVVFLVLNGQPVFWKHPELFYEESECKAATMGFVEFAESRGVPQVAGACLQIKMDRRL